MGDAPYGGGSAPAGRHSMDLNETMTQCQSVLKQTKYVTITKLLMLDHALQFVDRVIFHVGSQNIRSRKAMEKLGAVTIREVEVAYFGEATKTVEKRDTFGNVETDIEGNIEYESVAVAVKLTQHISNIKIITNAFFI